jgi:hypothetical protein
MVTPAVLPGPGIRNQALQILKGIPNLSGEVVCSRFYVKREIRAGTL